MEKINMGGKKLKYTLKNKHKEWQDIFQLCIKKLFQVQAELIKSRKRLMA